MTRLRDAAAPRPRQPNCELVHVHRHPSSTPRVPRCASRHAATVRTVASQGCRVRARRPRRRSGEYACGDARACDSVAASCNGARPVNAPPERPPPSSRLPSRDAPPLAPRQCTRALVRSVYPRMEALGRRTCPGGGRRRLGWRRGLSGKHAMETLEPTDMRLAKRNRHTIGIDVETCVETRSTCDRRCEPHAIEDAKHMHRKTPRGVRHAREEDARAERQCEWQRRRNVH